MHVFLRWMGTQYARSLGRARVLYHIFFALASCFFGRLNLVHQMLVIGNQPLQSGRFQLHSVVLTVPH